MAEYISLQEDQLRRQYRHLRDKGILLPFGQGGINEDGYVALCLPEPGSLDGVKLAIDRSPVVAVFFDHDLQALFCDRAELGRILILELERQKHEDQMALWDYLADEKTRV